jgi:hypothetical protein
VRKTFWASALAALVGCGSSDGSNGTGDGSIAGCTLTVSGGTSGTYPCTLRAAVWSNLSDVGQILVGRSATADAPAISATVSFPGEPIEGTYTDDNPDAKSRMTVTSGTAPWTMNVGGSTPNSGAYTMVLTRVAATKASGDNQIHAVSGTLDATLPRSRERRRAVTWRCRRPSESAGAGRCLRRASRADAERRAIYHPRDTGTRALPSARSTPLRGAHIDASLRR